MSHPNGRVKRISRTTAPVLSLATLRAHCEIVTIDIDSDAGATHPDDALLLAYLDAAVGHAEKFTGRTIQPATLELALDKFPEDEAGIELPGPPLIELLSFTQSDSSDGAMSVDDYMLDDYGDVAELRPMRAWPGLTSDAGPNAIKARYRAGYQTETEPDSDAMPLEGMIKAALLLTVGHLYANREASTEKSMAELPLGVEALLRPLRVRTGMA